MFELLPAIVTLVALWHAASRAGKRQGRNWFFRNLLAGLISGIAAFVVFFAMISGGGVAFVGFVLAVASVVIAWNGPRRSTPPVIDATRIEPPRSATEGEIAAAEAARVRSLKAVQAATSARQREIQSEQRRMDAPGPSEPVQLPTTIRFRYMGRDGDVTVRTVDVRAATTDGVNDYIEGVCHLSRKPRSFRLDRVISDITDTDTGEMFDADAWFAAVPDKGLADFDLPSRAPARGDWRTAVMFVGFRDARRHDLEALADAAGWHVRQRFSETLNVVVAGSLAGQNQLDKAREFGAEVISEDDFRARV